MRYETQYGDYYDAVIFTPPEATWCFRAMGVAAGELDEELVMEFRDAQSNVVPALHEAETDPGTPAIDRAEYSILIDGMTRLMRVRQGLLDPQPIHLARQTIALTEA